MQLIRIKSMEELPEYGNFVLPEFSQNKVHYRATAWAYLNSNISGRSVFVNDKEYTLERKENQ